MKHRSSCGLLILGVLLTPAMGDDPRIARVDATAGDGQPIVTAYPSIQAAVDANPGQIVWVPTGDYLLTDAIRIRHARSGLCGPGRLIQSNPNAAVIELQSVNDVSVRDLTLTRSPDQTAARTSALTATECDYLSLDNVNVIDNRSAAASIRLERCRHASVVRCVVRNYMTISVDDRTASPHFGYAFRCIDGSGIVASSCQDVLLQANRIIEEQYRPTREMKELHQLGQFTARAAAKGSLVNQATWDAGYVNNWHQGSAMVVTDPEESAFVRLIDNHIEHAAQGIDLHADFVTCTGNLVVNAFVGMKAMHGSRHVLIANNQFVRNDLWSIGLMPGVASHGPVAADGGAAPQAANADGGSVIANNIISEFGYGDSHWIWDPQQHTCAPILFDHGQEPDDPPLSDVIITGNVVCDSGNRWGNAGSAAEPPRYRFAVYVSSAPNGPRELHFNGNLFHPGTEGVSNIKLDP
jgi:hypothetical protein